MHNSCHAVKQPFMRTIPNVIDIVIVHPAQVRPPFGNNRPYACCMYSVENDSGDPFWVFQYNTTKPNINWGWTGSKKGQQVGRGIVFRGFTEEETTDVWGALLV
jgi:hypothetical protein